jgi:hypothetical protein
VCSSVLYVFLHLIEKKINSLRQEPFYFTNKVKDFILTCFLGILLLLSQHLILHYVINNVNHEIFIKMRERLLVLVQMTLLNQIPQVFFVQKIKAKCEISSSK